MFEYLLYVCVQFQTSIPKRDGNFVLNNDKKNYKKNNIFLLITELAVDSNRIQPREKFL